MNSPIGIFNRTKPLTKGMIAKLANYPTTTHVIQSNSGVHNRVLKQDLIGFKLLGIIGGTANRFTVAAVEYVGYGE